MKTKFETPFQMSTRCINQASVAMAAGMYVETLRQAATRRAIFYFDDTAAIRDLLEKFERRECLPIPAKNLLNARTELYHLAAKAIREVI
jgi:hypothetical protein